MNDIARVGLAREGVVNKCKGGGYVFVLGGVCCCKFRLLHLGVTTRDWE